MGLGQGTSRGMLCPAMVLSGLVSSLWEMLHAVKIARVTFLRYSRAAGKKEINHSIQFKNSIGRKQYKKKQMQGVLGPSWAFGCSHLTASPSRLNKQDAVASGGGTGLEISVRPEKMRKKKGDESSPVLKSTSGAYSTHLCHEPSPSPTGDAGVALCKLLARINSPWFLPN